MMNKKISFYTFYSFIIALFFFKPTYFNQLGIFDDIFNLIRYGIAVMPILNYFVRYKKFNLGVFLVILFRLLCLGPTIFNSGDIPRFVLYSLLEIGIVCFLNDAFERKKYNQLISGFSCYFNFAFIITFILIIIFPDGIFKQDGGYGLFIEIDNLLLPLIALATILNYEYFVTIKRNRLMFYVTMCIMFFPLVFYATMTSLISLILGLTIVLLLRLIRKPLIVIAPITIVLLTITMILLRTSPFITDFLSDVVGKSNTFSGRTYTWDAFWNMISNDNWKMIYGFGIHSSNMVFVPEFGKAMHFHNQYLNILYEGGLVQLLYLFIFVVVLLIISNLKYKKISNKNKIKKYSLYIGILCSFLIYMFFELYRNFSVFIFILYIIYENANNDFSETKKLFK